jgi:hypothetical protein
LTHRSDDCFIASNQIVKDLRDHPAIRRRPADCAASKAASARAYRRSHAVYHPNQNFWELKEQLWKTAEGGTEPACLQSSVAIFQSNKPHPLWQEAFENFVSIAQPPHFVRFVTTQTPA